jgi:hypothetical protein
MLRLENVEWLHGIDYPLRLYTIPVLAAGASY